MQRLIAIIAILGLSTALHAAPVASKLYGSWRIAGVADAQETASMTSDDADKLAGKEFLVAHDRVQFEGEVCQGPQFKATRHRTREMFRREYRFEPQDMGLPDPVTQVEISCKNPVIYFVYLKRNNALILYWKGFFLNAVRQQH